jgi:hypothetical protein
VWLGRSAMEEGAKLRGFRHGLRGPFARDVAPLVFADTAHVAPDRPPNPGEHIYFDGEWLRIENDGRRAPRAVVTDTSYADFELSLLATGDALPTLELGKTLAGADACPWPRSAPATGATSTLVVRRSATTLDLRMDEIAGPSCAIADGRVTIAIAAPEGRRIAVRKLSILRR